MPRRAPNGLPRAGELTPARFDRTGPFERNHDMPNTLIPSLWVPVAFLVSGGASALPFQEDTKTFPVPYAKEVDAPARTQPAPSPLGERARAAVPVVDSGSRIAFPIHDVDEDGAALVAGRTYKARFGPEGATYVPFFGSSARRNFPVRFRTSAVAVGGDPLVFEASTPGVRLDTTVRFERGAFVEEYAIQADGIEQRFVFAVLPRRGELRVAIDVAGELEPGVDGGGFRFGNELGYVTYGEALALDADGSRITLDSYLVDGRIELVVPAAFVERAALPLLIDPFITTIAVESGAQDDLNPDVAVEPFSSNALVAYEYVFSATDHDVYVRAFDDQVLQWTVAIDTSIANWENPRVAANRDATNWLVVAEVGAEPNRVIRGRRVLTGPALDVPFTISGGESGDKHDPDVGGDVIFSLLGPTNYCVVWQRDYSATDTDIFARIVENDGSFPGGVIALVNTAGTLDRNPSISKTNGRGSSTERDWMIVFEHEYAATDTDIQGARVHFDGTITTSLFTVASSSTDERDPTASELLDDHGVPRLWMAAYEYGSGLRLRTFDGIVSSQSIDLSPALFNSHGEPDLATDGRLWHVTYRSSFNVMPGADTDVLAASLSEIAGTLYFSESPVAIASSTSLDETRPRIASTFGSGNPYRSYIAYQTESTSSLNDIRAGVYDSPVNAGGYGYCFGTNAACPCGNAGDGISGCENSAVTGGARLTASGTWFITSDSAVLTATQLPATAPALYFQGSSDILSGSPFGDGLLCVSGTITRMAVKFAVGGVSHFPEAGDPDLHVAGLVPATGGYRYYQAWHRDSLPFCTAAVFNLTNGVALLWAP